MEEEYNSNPNTSNEDAGNQATGYIAKGLDPVGKVLEKGLSPLGTVVGGVTKPITATVGKGTKPVLGPFTGTKEEKVEFLGGDKSAESLTKQKPEQFGGKEQTKDNPLGL